MLLVELRVVPSTIPALTCETVTALRIGPQGSELPPVLDRDAGSNRKSEML